MSKARRAVAGLLAGVAAFVAVFVAASGTAHATAIDVVDVHVSTDGGVVRAGVWFGTAPVGGASVDTNTGNVCVGIGMQRPLCTQQDVVSSQAQAMDLSVITIDRDASDGDVGVYTHLGRQPLLGIRYDIARGELCAGFSYQIPFCVQVGIVLS